MNVSKPLVSLAMALALTTQVFAQSSEETDQPYEVSEKNTPAPVSQDILYMRTLRASKNQKIALSAEAERVTAEADLVAARNALQRAANQLSEAEIDSIQLAAQRARLQNQLSQGNIQPQPQIVQQQKPKQGEDSDHSQAVQQEMRVTARLLSVGGFGSKTSARILDETLQERSVSFNAATGEGSTINGLGVVTEITPDEVVFNNRGLITRVTFKGEIRNDNSQPVTGSTDQSSLVRSLLRNRN